MTSKTAICYDCKETFCISLLSWMTWQDLEMLRKGRCGPCFEENRRVVEEEEKKRIKEACERIDEQALKFISELTGETWFEELLLKDYKEKTENLQGSF